MNPNIRYAQTSDGFSIAYWSLGEGDALVEMPPTPFSHVALEWDFQNSATGTKPCPRTGG